MPQGPKQHRKNIIYGSAWRKARARALVRDGYRCQIRAPGCLGVATTVDHILEVDRGGAWYDLRNLQSACTWCHFGWKRKVRGAPKRSVKPSREW